MCRNVDLDQDVPEELCLYRSVRKRAYPCAGILFQAFSSPACFLLLVTPVGFQLQPTLTCLGLKDLVVGKDYWNSLYEPCVSLLGHQSDVVAEIQKLLLCINRKLQQNGTFSAGMSNSCILGPNWIFNFAESRRHLIRCIIEEIYVKLHKVFADTSDMTTLQSSGVNSTAFVLLVSETR